VLDEEAELLVDLVRPHDVGVVEDEHGALVREVAEGHHQARDEHPPRVGADLGEAQRFVQVLRERLGQPRTT
jgi:hypothetical protein